MAPCLRPFLAISQTTLSHPITGTRYPFLGLFTTVDLEKGSFLGFYNGTFKEGEYRGTDSYTFGVSDFHIRPPKKNGKVDAARYPIAMCNEPPVGVTANTFAVEMNSAKEAIPNLPSKARISALAYFTCRDVKAGEELFINYGKAYEVNRKKYPHYGMTKESVGPSCRLTKKERELPVDMLKRFGIFYVDNECYVEYED